MTIAASIASLWRKMSAPPAAADDWRREIAASLEASNRRLAEIEDALQRLAVKVSDRHDPCEFDINNLRDRDQRWHNIAELRKLAKAVLVTENTVLCRALGKYKQYVSGIDVGYSPNIILDGFWEYPVTEFIARNVSTGMTVLDLGANFGYFTLLMADLVGESGQVYGFEPNPLAMNALKETLYVNGFFSRVTLDTRAIWDKSGDTVTFHIPDAAPINARIVEPLDGRLPPSNPGLLTVETVALDDLPVTGVSLIKADIEGAEERLWRGSHQFLANNPDTVLLLEFNGTRCTDPRAMIEDISHVFSLRYLGDDSYVKEITAEEVLASKYDWMLVLSHKRDID